MSPLAGSFTCWCSQERSLVLCVAWHAWGDCVEATGGFFWWKEPSQTLENGDEYNQTYSWWFRNPKQPPGMYEKTCKSYVILSISTALISRISHQTSWIFRHKLTQVPLPCPRDSTGTLHCTQRGADFSPSLAAPWPSPDHGPKFGAQNCVFYWESRFQGKVKHVWFIGAHVYIWTLIFLIDYVIDSLFSISRI